MTNYAATHQALTDAGERKKPLVIHMSKAGGRGTNTKLYKPAHVILAFKITSFTDAIQSIGRGERSGNVPVEATWVVANQDRINKGSPAGILNTYKQAEQTLGW